MSLPLARLAGDPHDADAVKLALGMEGVDVNHTNNEGRHAFWCLLVHCAFEKDISTTLVHTEE